MSFIDLEIYQRTGDLLHSFSADPVAATLGNWREQGEKLKSSVLSNSTQDSLQTQLRCKGCKVANLAFEVASSNRFRETESYIPDVSAFRLGINEPKARMHFIPECAAVIFLDVFVETTGTLSEVDRELLAEVPELSDMFSEGIDMFMSCLGRVAKTRVNY